MPSNPWYSHAYYNRGICVVSLVEFNRNMKIDKNLESIIDSDTLRGDAIFVLTSEVINLMMTGILFTG